MKVIPVQSSNIKGIGYDRDRRELRVLFATGAAHDYLDVPPEKHSALMAAESHGSHFHRHIRGQHAERKAGGEPTLPEAPARKGLDDAVRRWRGEEE